MRMVRWMCGVKLKDRLPSKELRERLGVDDIALVLQQNRLRWNGHVLQKDDDDWVKKCMEHEVEGSRPRGRPKKTWKEVVREDCQARKLNKEDDAMDHCKWSKVIKEARWSGWVWVGECFFWYRPTRVVPDQRPLNGRCCCCCHSNITKNWVYYINRQIPSTYVPELQTNLVIVEPNVCIDVLARNCQRPQFLHIEHLVWQLRDFRLGLCSRFHYPVSQVTYKVKEEVTLWNTNHWNQIHISNNW